MRVVFWVCAVYCVLADKDKVACEIADRVRAVLRGLGVEYGGEYDGSSMVFACGDDAFVLSVFRELGVRQVPVLGIGGGVLSEANHENYENVVRRVVRGGFAIDERARLVASFDGRESPFALNEIGIFPRRSAELLRYALGIDNEYFFRDTADGVIVSTPTGSTGYAMSAGGPMVIGDADVFTVTPVSPMRRSYAPIVVSSGARIRISGLEAKSSVCAVVDGVVRIAVDCDCVEVVRSSYPALFVKPKNSQSIVERLRKRSVGVNHAKVKSLSPSAKLVYKVLGFEGEMTQKEIVERTYLPQRTVRYALEVLSSAGVIQRRASLLDVRQTVYSV